jgi:hypothetical protein
MSKSCVAPPNNLISWWTGDGTANDFLGANNGVLENGATFNAGLAGPAFLLNGINQYIDAGNNASLQVSAGDFTVMAWVNFAALSHPPGANTNGSPQGDMSILDKMAAAGANSDGWRLLKQNDNHFWFCLGGGAANGCVAGNNTTVVSQTAAALNTWYHVAAVKSAGLISIYVNGSLEATTNLGAFADSNTTDLLLGANAGFGATLNGLIDEAQIFGRALTSAEIQNIYNAGSAGECKFQIQ